MVETKFKHTEIGLIPYDWEVKTIKEFADITTGSQNTQDHVDDGKYPFFVRSPKVERINKYIFDTEGVVTAGDGVGTGKIYHYINGKFGLHQRCYLMYNFADVSAKYFYWIFSRNFYDRVQSMTAKSSVDSVRMEMIADMSIPLPPTLAEQERIAGALSSIDTLIGALNEQIEKKRAIKVGAMRKLLERNDIEPILLDELVKNGDVKLYRGKVISKKDIEACPGDFPIYSSSVQNNGLMGCYGKYMFDEEMISWSVDGGGNFFYRPKHKFSITNVSGYMRINRDRYDYQFLAFLLQYEHAKKVFDYQTKAHPSVIRMAYELKIPDLSEQREMASILSSMDIEIASLEQKRDKYIAIKQGMMQQLLTGKIRLI